MTRLQKLVSVLSLGLCLSGTADGVPLLELPSIPAREEAEVPLEIPATIEAAALNEPLQRGHWTVACARATAALAQAQPLVEALGVFALCAALQDDTEAFGRALQRLREAETSPYYAVLAQSIADLHAKGHARALSALRRLSETHPEDGLTRYFIGEGEYAGGDGEAARQSFTAVLKVWPKHAPAMVALSRLDATDGASDAALQRAIGQMENATQVEPANRAYWRWLAALCERAGQTSRAQAIALQRLQGWQPARH